MKTHSHAGRIIQAIISIFVVSFFTTSCRTTEDKTSPSFVSFIDTSIHVYGPWNAIQLPISKGVKIANPIQVASGPGGYIYAANATGEIYTLRDTDHDTLEDMALLYADIKEFGLRSPGGFAYRGDTIFIGTAQQIRAFLDKDNDGKADTSWVFFNDIPTSEHPYEWTSGLSFGPDNWLYAALTTDSWNAGASADPKKYRGSIIRISPNGKKAEVVATGIRSVYGMGFHENGDLFFTDNEGGGNPTEELNLMVPNAFYGHNKKKFANDSVQGPVFSLETEMAPSGIAFNAKENDFGSTSGDLFVAFYGPGERWTRGSIGRVRITKESNGTYSFEEHAVADIPKVSAITFGTDGSLYAAYHGKADYWYNAIYPNEGRFYKLVFDPNKKGKTAKPRVVLASSLPESSIEAGKQLFAERACLGCHAVDGTTDLLGPNLKDIAKQFGRDELLHEIMNPSDRIKSSMMATRITKKDGQTLIGRIINSDDKEVTLMLVGNHLLNIPRPEIEKAEDIKKSLMYEGLVSKTEEQQAIIDYLVSLSLE